MKSYLISPLASRDLDDISDYFAGNNVNAGERFIEDFNKKCNNLVSFPNIGRIYNEVKTPLRGIPLSGYINHQHQRLRWDSIP
jgi:toxin ParE1/3/4